MLGKVNTICVNKTGTLTMNKLTVTHIWRANKAIEVE
jgi:P-type E1-E2 ATPase